MRHADAELQLWIANDRIAREQREADLAKLVSHGSGTPSLRQRAGRAVISLGEHLAGEAPRVDAPRLMTRAF